MLLAVIVCALVAVTLALLVAIVAKYYYDPPYLPDDEIFVITTAKPSAQ